MSEPTAIVLFDGVCNLCHGSVRFILKRDPREHFRFASLQSDPGRDLLREYDLPEDLSTIVLIENGRAFHRSSAALRIARRLRGAWPLLAVFLVIPPPLRDLVYRFIANNRYRWFGKKDVCSLPEPGQAARFLENDA